jgi:hypothetical protein
MDLITILIILLTVAIGIERVLEIIKPLYLEIKNYFGKMKFSECSKMEKIIMSILIGPSMCIISQIGIDIPSVNEAALIQYILAGLIASMGSNFIHTLLSIAVALKDGAESIKTGNSTE